MSGTRRKAGALCPQVEGYRDWLTQQGYTQGTIRNMLKDLGQVGRWLTEQALKPEDLNEQQIEAFRSARQAAGSRWLGVANMLRRRSSQKLQGSQGRAFYSPQLSGVL